MSDVKLILLGDSVVGKSAILLRFLEKFTGYTNLTFVDFHVKKIYFYGKDISIMIWDTTGLEQLQSTMESYYHLADGALLIYDVTNPATFYRMYSRLHRFKDLNSKAEILIAGNKNDDLLNKKVDVSLVQNFANHESLEYMEMSAMWGYNVKEAILHLTKKVLIAKGVLTEDILLADTLSPA